MGKKSVMEPTQDTQANNVSPERKKGASTKPKEAKKPVAKVSSPKARASTKAKAKATEPVSPTPDAINAKAESKKEKAKTMVAAKTKLESIKQKIKALKKQWITAIEKVDELKELYKVAGYLYFLPFELNMH